MEDNLKIPKLNNLGHLLATPPRGYSQNNLECRKFCRTNDPFSFVNDWQENIKGKKRKIKFKKFRKNISQIQLQHVDFNLIQIQTKCRNTHTYHTHTHTHTHTTQWETQGRETWTLCIFDGTKKKYFRCVTGIQLMHETL